MIQGMHRVTREGGPLVQHVHDVGCRGKVSHCQPQLRYHHVPIVCSATYITLSISYLTSDAHTHGWPCALSIRR